MLLALDTSTRQIGIALYNGVRVIHETVWRSQNHHTVELVPAIDAALDHTGVSINKIKVIAVATGPGSYTGLRIGLAVAKGLALAHNTLLVGVPTLDFLAAAQPLHDLPLVAVLEAGRGRLAANWYQAEGEAWASTGSAEVLEPQELSSRIRKPTLVCGELNHATRKLLARKRKNVLLSSPAQSLRRPAYLAEMAWARWQAGEVDDPATLTPTYLQAGAAIPS